LCGHGVVSDAKDLGEIRMGSPQKGYQMQVGWDKVCEFPTVACYILEMM